MIEQFEFAEGECRDLAACRFQRAVQHLLKADCNVIVDATLKENGDIGKGVVTRDDVMKISMTFPPDVG